MSVTGHEPGPASWARTMFGLDTRSLALFRVGLALVLLVDLLERAPDLTAHYSDDGVLPRSALPAVLPVSVHVFHGSAVFQAVLFAAAGGVAVALLVGRRTALMTFLSWLLLISLHARNPLVLHGGDLLLRMLLFWGMFLPLGASASVDAVRRGPAAGDRLVCSAATVALLLQVCFVYGFGLAARNHPAWWSEGTAVADALYLDQYATPLGRWARDLPDGVLRAATYATLAVEGLGPVLLLLSGGFGVVRALLVAVFVLFHVLLGLSLRLGTFSLVCVVAWLPFLPSWFWDTVAARLAGWRPVLAVRGLLGAAAGAPVPGLPPEPARLSPVASAVVVLALAYVFLFNLRTVDPERFGGALPDQLRAAGAVLALEQSWGMFAPYPKRDDGWYVVVGNLRGGRQLDLFRGAELSWEKPERISATYPTSRWAAYLSLLPQARFASLRPYLAEYLGRRWDARHAGEESVESVEVYFMLRFLLPDRGATPPEKVLLERVERGPGAADGP